MESDASHAASSAAPATRDDAVRTRYGAAPRAPERLWQELLAQLDQGSIIPIVGPGAVVMEGELGPRPVSEYVARRAEYQLELEPLTPPEQTLTPHQVACRYLDERRGPITDVYVEMNLALAAECPPSATPPAALMKLAGIQAFRLYVTTTFDDLLDRAVGLQRLNGKLPEPLAYAPEKAVDLPVPTIAQLNQPLVYHLLGRASPLPKYVVTEEDTLEFVHSLQSENRSPKYLMRELQSHPLLIIGSGYSDWLARFFIRIAKPDRLRVASKDDYFADARNDSDFKHFLRHFSTQTRVVDMQALVFIDELADRWAQYVSTRPASPTPAVGTGDDADRAIFLSYANEPEDAQMARSIHDVLRAEGLPVWLDVEQLSGGDEFSPEIRKKIEQAPLFVPLISARTRTVDKRFFVREWRAACHWQEAVPFGQPYIVPVAMDGTLPDAPWLPDEFKKVQWIRIDRDGLGGVAQQIKSKYREYQRARRGM
jgi:TIR domain/SIR2-like domain